MGSPAPALCHTSVGRLPCQQQDGHGLRVNPIEADPLLLGPQEQRMPGIVFHFAVVVVGMLASCCVGWQIGRIMSTRPAELREAAQRVRLEGGAGPSHIDGNMHSLDYVCAQAAQNCAKTLRSRYI